MNELYFKRGVEFTPLIFQKEEFLGKKYARILLNPCTNYSFNASDEYDKLGDCLDGNIVYRNKPRRTGIAKYSFFGGMSLINSNNDINLLIVTKNSNGEKYIIVDKGFYEIWITSLTRLKKQMNLIGISSRTKLIFKTGEEMYTEFQEIFSPTMQDYLPETQLEVSKQFLEYINQNNI